VSFSFVITWGGIAEGLISGVIVAALVPLCVATYRRVPRLEVRSLATFETVESFFRSQMTFNRVKDLLFGLPFLLLFVFISSASLLFLFDTAHVQLAGENIRWVVFVFFVAAAGFFANFIFRFYFLVEGNRFECMGLALGAAVGLQMLAGGLGSLIDGISDDYAKTICACLGELIVLAAALFMPRLVTRLSEEP
jgi:hypothetical protein